MSIDKYYDDYTYYAMEYPEEYKFATTCLFKDAIRAVEDVHCPQWAYNILQDRIKTEFAEENKIMIEKKLKAETDKKDFLTTHPNSDICIINLALAIYGENSKKMMCDKISLEKSIDYALELYKKKF